jgi:Lar family restriction alleviation protein
MTNAEKFRTPQERLKAHLEFCNEQKHCYSCELRLDNENCGGKVCVFRWLELEYKEKELKPCPFCGSKAKIVDYRPSSRPSGVTYYFVECEECFGKSVSKLKRDEAIAAWNRRVNEVG